ncbi:MAG: DUF3592 domain-containing protein [Ruminococcaceae bacterium]|nr:DUF3592 domain-containing protein [Oscillospiraceae bacterium]
MKKFICFGLSLLFLLGGIAWSVGRHISRRDEIAANKLYNDSLVKSICTITYRSPQGNHKRTYDYVYTVNGVEYTGQATLQVKIGKRVQMHNIHHVGDTITVWYDPADPSISMLGKPDPTGNTWTPVLYGFLLSAATFFLTVKWAFSDD